MAIDITPHSLSVNKLIRSYGNSGFRIGDQFYNGSVFVLNESVVPWAVTGSNFCFVESLEAHVKNAAGVVVALDDPPTGERAGGPVGDLFAS